MRRYPGVVIATVLDREDPLGQGRIKLSFPWMPNNQSSSWAPVATSMAGKERGQWFMPEVGDEVLVAFEHGDFEHPFVVGFLWNGVDTPPSASPEERIIVTPGGHELRFHDKAGEQEVLVRTAGGMQLRLDDAGKTVSVETAGNLSVKLDDNSSSITLSGGGRSITLGQGQVKIT